MAIPLPDGVSASDVASLINDKYDGSTENKAALRRDVARLASGEPLAYVIGWIPFLGLKIHLDSKPLIPRPETEWWAEELANAVRKSRLDQEAMTNGIRQFRLLDLCAGSGAIGCAILKRVPNVFVTFGEIMPEHEKTIRMNIESNNLDANSADIGIGDLFEPFSDEKFDIIAVNPPYIPEGRSLPHAVAGFEPREALFGGPDGFSIIRRIAAGAPAHLEQGGELWMECDIENVATARELLQAGGARNTELRNDLYGRPRLIVGYY